MNAERELRQDVADLRDALAIAADHLAQYRKYAEHMRAIGRGFSPSSPFSPEYTEGIIRNALAASANR